MSNDEIQIIGKKVKDMYGTPVGKVVGTISDIDGSIQTVGVDCGADGLRQIQFEQLVVQTDVVIFIPKWRLDSQRLLREKGLTLRRLKALIDLVSENDDMKESAEMLHEKYKSKLSILDETENKINAQLDARTAELDEQIKSVKMLIFDAKMQYKSNEISESTFESVKTQTSDLIEHITHEQAEISNVQRRLQDLSVEVQITEAPPKLPEVPEQAPDIPIQQHTQPISAPIITPVQQASSSHDAISTNEKKTEESDWLSRMEAQ